MTGPSITEVATLAKEIVEESKKNDSLESATRRLVRREVEKRLGVEEGQLDSQNYRDVIRIAIDEALAEEEDEDDNKLPPSSPVRPKKRKSNTTKAEEKAKPAPKKARTSGASTSKGKKKAGEEEEEDAEDAEPEMKKKTTKARAKKEKEKPAPKKAVSKAVIESDAEDEEQETMAAKPSSSAKPSSKASPIKPPSSVSKPKSQASPGKVKKPLPSPSSPKKGKEAEKQVEDVAEKSDSEMSVLIDDGPPKKRKNAELSSLEKKTASKTKTKSEPKKRGRKAKEPEELSKEDAEIKRLKSFIVACGVRKQWARDFKSHSISLEDKSGQIKRLKEILSELGMKGRLSLEQAKAIREKRELEEELEEVQKFAKNIDKLSKRKRGERTLVEDSEAEDVSDKDGSVTSDQPRKLKKRSNGDTKDESEEEEDVPKKHVRRKTAAQSILAFLQDQSDDE